MFASGKETLLPADENYYPLQKKLARLLEKYQKIANADPSTLRAQIPPEELWRFFIDGTQQKEGRGLNQMNEFKKPSAASSMFFSRTAERHNKTIKQLVIDEEKLDESNWQEAELIKLLHLRAWTLPPNLLEKFTLNDILSLDHGWIPFEVTEKNYLKALYSAFQTAIDPNKKLGEPFVKELHKLATENVSNLKLKTTTDKNHEFRTGTMNYGLISSNEQFGTSTIEGIQQILDTWNEHPQIEFLIPLNANPKIRMHIGLSSTSNNLKKSGQPTDDAVTKEIEVWEKKISKARAEKKLARLIMKEISKINNEQAVIVHHRVFSKNAAKQQQVLSAEFHKILKQYQTNLEKHADRKIDLLTCIVQFIQECEQLHPFGDANCRVFCMLLLQHELLANGFPFSILKNPNHFDAFSVPQLVKEVIDGIERTFELLKTGNVFDVKTKDILKSLENNVQKDAFFQEQLDYFKQVVEIEKQARVIDKQLNLKH